jgi:hypothetical protein
MSRKLMLLFAIGLGVRLGVATYTYSGDVNNHISWGKDVLAKGLAGIYSREFFFEYGTMTPTYPPVPIWLFTASQWLFETTNRFVITTNASIPLFPSQLVWWFEDQDVQPAFHKIWAIIADLIIAWVVYVKKGFKYALFAVCLNPAFWYTSAVWGQIESIPIMFIILAIYFLPDRPYLSTTFSLLAVLTKQTTIIFLPLLAIQYLSRHSQKTNITCALLFILGFWAAFSPFQVNPLSTYLNKLQTGSGSRLVVDHAFNSWYLIPSLRTINDDGYQLVGLGLFIASLLWILAHKKDTYLSAGLIGWSAFLLLTRMHERYFFPSIPLLILATPSHPRHLLFLSLFYTANLYHNWWAPRIPILVNLLSYESVILVLIGIVIAMYFQLMAKLRHATS